MATPGSAGGALSELMASRQSSCISQRAISTPRRLITYSRGFNFEVVGDVHRRNDETQLQRQVAAQCLYPLQQLSALLDVDQRHQAVSDFEAELVELQQSLQRSWLACGSFAGGAAAEL